MADDITFDVAANDKASATLDKVDKKVDGLGDAGSRWEASLQKVDTSNRQAGASLGALGTKLGIAGAAIGTATAGATKLYSAMSSAQQVASDYATSFERVQQAVENTNVSQARAEQLTGKLNDRINELASEAGMRIPRVAEAAETLTFRLDDAAGASDNLRRLVGLMAKTGENAEQVGKDLAEALDGDINAMKELGVLTDSQVQKFNQISDRGERTAKVMEILDKKLQGVIEQNKATQSTSERTSRSFERMQAAIGSLAVVDTPLDNIATLTETMAKEVEEFAGVWDDKTPGIKARIAEVEASTKSATDQTKALKEELETVSDPTDQADRLRKIAKQRAETQLFLLDEQVRKRDDLVESDLQVQLARKRINERLEQELANIDARFGKNQQALGQQQKQLEVLRLQTLAAEAGSEAERARLNAQAKLLSTQIEYEKKLKDTEDTQKRQLLMSESELKERKIRADLEERLSALADKRADQRQKAAEDEEIVGMTMAEQLELQKRLTQEYKWQNSFIDSQIDALRKSVDVSEDRADAILSGFRERAADREFDPGAELEAEEQRIKAENTAQRLSRGFAIAGGAGEAGGGFENLLAKATAANEVAQDATDAEKERAAAIRRSNERLARQINQYSQLSGVIGEVGSGLAELAEVQWDFSEAGDASLSALNALSGAGKATAGLLGKNTKQQAGIQAGFEAAAAAGALGLALTTQNPSFYAAAAQHTTAAGLYTAVASGAAGSGTGAPTGGSAAGGGGGGRTGGRPALDVDQQREKSITALADALKEERQPRQIVNNYSFGTTIAESPQIRRELEQFSRDAQQDRIVRERN